MKVDVNELTEELLHIKEDYHIEIKKSRDLPKSFWETYSAFANTEGGNIILGVAEGNPVNTIIGVNNPDKIIDDIWNILSNKNKVSYRIIDNNNIHKILLEDKYIIIVSVKEAPDSLKPIYINNRLENTYIRTNDGDRKATEEEIASFMRNVRTNSDSLTLTDCTLSDLDTNTLLIYKQRVSQRYPKKNFDLLSTEEFLLEIGACTKDRKDNSLKIKKGTLLFLGKYNSIKEHYPHYHLDYFNRRGSNPRWTDRVSDDEISDYEMNLFNFFTIVFEKLQNLILEGFSLKDDKSRTPVSNFDESLREALVNCLAHADYEQNYPSIRIEAFNGGFKFLNPGKLLVSKSQYLVGGDSRPRNEIIMKLFRLLGYSERQGFGGPQIFKSALENDFRCPEIESNLERTELRIWNTDLIDSYPELNEKEKIILNYILKAQRFVTFSELQKDLSISEYYLRISLRSLENKKLVEHTGKGRATKYLLGRNNLDAITQIQMILDSIQKQLI